MPKTWKSGFTLIELLVVIAIIGLILALGIPAVTTLMKSGGLSAASREVSNTLSLARQYAITRRTNVRVVFPYTLTTGNGTYQAPRYQSYAAVYFDQSSQTWQYFGKWEFLPLGTVFMNDAFLANAPSPHPCLDNLLLSPSTFPFPDNKAGDHGTVAFIEFTPTGAATVTSGGSLSFTITEGTVDNTTKMPLPTSKNMIGGTTALANVVTVSVDSIVGHIKVGRP